jgi:hypothetical protein
MKKLLVAIAAALAAHGVLAAGESSPSPAVTSPHSGANPGMPHGTVPRASDVVVAKVAKAEGPAGRTVAEVFAQRAALQGKPVAIRATVVKVNAGVMGKNWVHLRDGSGSAADGSNDLIATSAEQEPKVGEVVVAKGVVRADVDIGAGYAFKVLVENASFGK